MPRGGGTFANKTVGTLVELIPRLQLRSSDTGPCVASRFLHRITARPRRPRPYVVHRLRFLWRQTLVMHCTILTCFAFFACPSERLCHPASSLQPLALLVKAREWTPGVGPPQSQAAAMPNRCNSDCLCRRLFARGGRESRDVPGSRSTWCATRRLSRPYLNQIGRVFLSSSVCERRTPHKLNTVRVLAADDVRTCERASGFSVT